MPLGKRFAGLTTRWKECRSLSDLAVRMLPARLKTVSDCQVAAATPEGKAALKSLRSSARLAGSNRYASPFSAWMPSARAFAQDTTTCASALPPARGDQSVHTEGLYLLYPARYRGYRALRSLRLRKKWLCHSAMFLPEAGLGLRWPCRIQHVYSPKHTLRGLPYEHR